jgi:hypothetical protein
MPILPDQAYVMVAHGHRADALPYAVGVDILTDLETGPAGDDVYVINENTDPRMTATTMTLQGATVTDTRPSTGGPDGRSFFRRHMNTANTSSPMSMPLEPTGTGGIPVVPGEAWVGSWYARKSPTGGPSPRMDVTWYDSAGVSLSTTAGASKTGTASWQRFEQQFTAPASAAFARPNVAWSGTALVNQDLDVAQAQFEKGTVATQYIDGGTVGAEWINGTPNASASRILAGHKFYSTLAETAAIDSRGLVTFTTDPAAAKFRVRVRNGYDHVVSGLQVVEGSTPPTVYMPGEGPVKVVVEDGTGSIDRVWPEAVLLNRSFVVKEVG